MWIVMTSAAAMPRSCWGRYRRVALVRINQEFTAKGLIPKMISTRAKGVLDVHSLGRHHAGSTARCALARAVARAEEMARAANSAAPIEFPGLRVTWGGSA